MDSMSPDLVDVKDATSSSSRAMRASVDAVASILSCCCRSIATVSACNFSIKTSSRADEEGGVILGDEDNGGKCSGECKLAGRTGSVGRKRRLYGPPDIIGSENYSEISTGKC